MYGRINQHAALPAVVPAAVVPAVPPVPHHDPYPTSPPAPQSDPNYGWEFLVAAINGIAVSLGKTLFQGVKGWWWRRWPVEDEVKELRLLVRGLGKDTFSIVIFSL